MPKAVVFGLLIAFVIIVLAELAPQPVGGMILGGVLATRFGAEAWQTWRRLRIGLTAVAYVVGAVNGCVVVWLAWHYGGLRQVPPPWIAAYVTCALTMWMLMRQDRADHPEIARLMRDKFEQASLWGVLAFQHIPQLDDLSGRHPTPRT